MISLICFILTLIGGINWLSIGIVQFDIFAGIFGSQAHVVCRILYSLIGVSAGWLVYKAIKEKGIINIKKDNFKKFKDQNDMLS